MVNRANPTLPEVADKMEMCSLHLFLLGRKNGPGGSGTPVTNGCAAKFFRGSDHGLPIICAALLGTSTYLAPSDSSLKASEEKS